MDPAMDPERRRFVQSIDLHQAKKEDCPGCISPETCDDHCSFPPIRLRPGRFIGVNGPPPEACEQLELDLFPEERDEQS